MLEARNMLPELLDELIRRMEMGTSVSLAD
jgi:hypothetical protein